MKRLNKGAISIYTLLAMMFFLIFVMVAYNNVAQKSKTQVETEGVLYNYYKSEQNATERATSLTAGNVSSSTAATLLKHTTQKNLVKTANANKYVYSNGKVYKIQ